MERTEDLIDLGAVTVETKGTELLGRPDVPVTVEFPERPIAGLSAD